MLHKLDPSNVKPCRHMETLVSAWVDGKLSGIKRWYTELHVKSCPQCQSSLPFLQTLHTRLSALESRLPAERMSEKLSETQWQTIEAAWTRSEEQKTAQPAE